MVTDELVRSGVYYTAECGNYGMIRRWTIYAPVGMLLEHYSYPSNPFQIKDSSARTPASISFTHDGMIRMTSPTH